jgi:sec-independent protein translocase protein TatA
MIDALAMFESPVQIAIVLVIALLVFGPKKLPEIGKQIGSALRELRKATNDLSHSFNTDYDPDGSSYSSHKNGGSSSSYYSPYTYEPPPDLTDYTLVGRSPSHSETSAPPATAYDDYAALSAAVAKTEAPATQPPSGETVARTGPGREREGEEAANA